MSFPFAPSQIQKCISLQDAILPMSTAAMALPPLSIRGDWGVLSTAATRYGPSLLKSFAQMGPQGALSAMKLASGFLEIGNLSESVLLYYVPEIFLGITWGL